MEERQATTTGSGAAPAKAARYPFIDALRGAAVVFMIETHTVNALLHQESRRGPGYDILTYLNGLVAPAFLFCAGLGFAIYLGRREREIASAGPAFRSYLRKCLFIVLLGYSLHVPVFSLSGMLASGPDAWTAFLQVDVLQVIGVTLIGLLLAAVTVRSRAGLTAAVLVLTAGFLLWWYVAPPGAPSALPGWAQSYFTRTRSPLFTLVPWGAFLTTGFLAGRRFAVEAAARREAKVIRSFAILSAALAGAAALATAFTKGLYPADAYWYWSAEYVLLRLASVGLAMCGLWFLLRGGGGRVSPVLELFGRESLPVYYIHLVIVYGKDFPGSFVRLFPEGAGYPFCLFLTVLLCAAMYAYAKGWSAAKRRWPAWTARAVMAVVAGSIISFVVG